MRILVPPGQRLPKVLARVLIAREEAIELRDALDLVQATGSSDWSVNLEYGEIEAVVTLSLDLDVPGNHFNPV